MRALILEKDVATRRLLEDVLWSRGHEVEVHEIADNVLTSFQKNRHSLVFLGWPIGDQHTFNLVKRIRSMSPPTETIIFVLGAGHRPRDLHEIIDAGASDYLKKPMTFSRLNTGLAMAEPQVAHEEVLAPVETPQQRQERLVQALKGFPVMMLAFDSNGDVIAWNNECERITGFQAAEIVRRPYAKRLLWPRGYSATDGGTPPRDWESTIIGKDGKVRMIQWVVQNRKPPVSTWHLWAIGVDQTAARQKFTVRPFREEVNLEESPVLPPAEFAMR